MRDIANKVTTLREATARSVLSVTENTVKLIKEGKIPKGDPLITAKIAAIQAAKNTWQIIPYCHQLPIDFVGVEFQLDKDSIVIDVTAKAIHKTGVEMEAMTAASVAALTIYDMVKFLDDHAEMEYVKLVSKTGGKTDFAKARRDINAAIIVMSDRVSKKKAEDKSGKLIQEILEANNIKTESFIVLPDEKTELITTVINLCDEDKIDMVLITGGTGIGPRDTTPEALDGILDMTLPGVAEAQRAYGQSRNPLAMLSRLQAGIRNNTIVISMPGSTGGVKDSMSVLFPHILHALDMLEGKCHTPKTTNCAKS